MRRTGMTMAAAILLFFGVMVMLGGCSAGLFSNKENAASITLRELFPSEIVKIEERYDGNGYLYATTDPALIDKFTEAFHNAKFQRSTDKGMWSGASGWTVTLKNGEKHSIVHLPGNLCEIDGVRYSYRLLDESSLKTFTKSFLQRENILKENAGGG